MSLAGNVSDTHFMGLALEQAELGLCASELPVGCVVVHSDRVISAAHNARYSSRSKLAHAEMLAIGSAQRFLYEHRGECDLYVTLEPCMMCMGAIIASRFRRLVYGATDHMAGATVLSTQRPHYQMYAPIIVGGVTATKSLELLMRFTTSTGATWTGQYFGADQREQK